MPSHQPETADRKRDNAHSRRLNAENGRLRRQIAELERANDQLELVNAALERFTAVAAHDLSAPLSVVAGYAALLRDRPEDLDAEQLDAVQRLARTVERMQLLLEDLGRYTQLGSAPPDRQRFELAPLLEEVLANLRPRLAAAETAVEVGKQLPSVYADRIQLSQVLQNLIDNAIKFGPEHGGTIRIAARRGSGGCTISVTDEGRGIAPEDQGRIFEPFRRLRGSNGIPGNGLGLAICKQIIAGHGGRLAVESSLDRGATLSVTLPD